jgi:hypothetical protein
LRLSQFPCLPWLPECSVPSAHRRLLRHVRGRPLGSRLRAVQAVGVGARLRAHQRRVRALGPPELGQPPRRRPLHVRPRCHGAALRHAHLLLVHGTARALRRSKCACWLRCLAHFLCLAPRSLQRMIGLLRVDLLTPCCLPIAACSCQCCTPAASPCPFVSLTFLGRFVFPCVQNCTCDAGWGGANCATTLQCSPALLSAVLPAGAYATFDALNTRATLYCNSSAGWAPNPKFTTRVDCLLGGSWNLTRLNAKCSSFCPGRPQLPPYR